MRIMMKMKIASLLQEKRGELLALAQYIRSHPEIAMEEVLSAEAVCALLEKEGFAVTRGVGGLRTAFTAAKKHGNGPRIAYIAEYDALPGNGHACGHHLIAAASAGAAIALGAALSDYEGEVALIGTPAEETAEGKPFLLKQGVFEGFDAVMMAHPSSVTDICPPTLCLGGFEYVFTGKPAHAGTAPDTGVNALDAVVLFYSAVNALRQQLRDGTRVHGIILEAGSAVNVIPDKGRVQLEIRAKEYTYYKEVVTKVENCAKGAALAAGCTLSSGSFEPECLALRYNPTLSGLFTDCLKDEGIFPEGQSGPLSTDMGNVSQFLPVLHPFVKMSEGNSDIHTQAFLAATDTDYAKERMLKTAKALAMTGLRLLEEPGLVEKAWAEASHNSLKQFPS